MSQKRMFDKAIIDTDRFMDLSMSAKALYFLLGMDADDEGFVSYKKIMRVHGGNEDDVKILLAKNFLIGFKSGVVVITDWNKNNYLDKTRIRPTEYQKEKSQLKINDKKEYCLTDVKQMLNQYSIEEYSIEENSIVSDKSHVSSKLSAEELYKKKQIDELIEKFIELDPKNKTYYGNKTQRKACQFLLDEYGMEQVHKMIHFIITSKGKVKYLPSITSPFELQEKWQKVLDTFSRKVVDQNEKLNNVIW